MTDTSHIQHAPALKVGGRRLSTSTKHKPVVHVDTTPLPTESTDDVVVDYPRPSPSANESPLHLNHQYEEEAPPRREKTDKNVKETAHWKTENTRPTRDTHSASKLHGTGTRISQPAGKLLGS